MWIAARSTHDQTPSGSHRQAAGDRQRWAWAWARHGQRSEASQEEGYWSVGRISDAIVSQPAVDGPFYTSSGGAGLACPPAARRVDSGTTGSVGTVGPAWARGLVNGRALHGAMAAAAIVLVMQPHVQTPLSSSNHACPRPAAIARQCCPGSRLLSSPRAPA